MAPQLADNPACICFPAPEEPLPCICSTIGLPVLRVESLPTSMLPLPTTAILVLMTRFLLTNWLKRANCPKVARYRLGRSGTDFGSRLSPAKSYHARPLTQLALGQWPTM